MWIGGWYNNYDFVGDIDEVRISKVARTPDWVKLEYENQKPMQTLVRPVVQSGQAFSVCGADRGSGGEECDGFRRGRWRRKVYWVLKRSGRETVVAVDRFHFTFDAGRVTGDESATLQVKAIYPNEVKSRDIAIAITEAIPDPVFTLQAAQCMGWPREDRGRAADL